MAVNIPPPPEAGGTRPAPGATATPTPAPATTNPDFTKTSYGTAVSDPRGMGTDPIPPELEGVTQGRYLLIKLAANELTFDQLTTEEQKMLVRELGFDGMKGVTQDQFAKAYGDWTTQNKGVIKTYLEAGGAAPNAGSGEAGPGGPGVGKPDVKGAGGKDKEDPFLAKASSMYFKLWGALPQDKWLGHAKDVGNVFELEMEERSKPAFMETITARDEAAGFAAQVASTLGLR